MPTRPLLYIAGPYTATDPVVNTRAAILVGDIVYRETHWLPLVPHVSLLNHLVAPHEPEHWYDYDLHLLEHCQAIVRLPGESLGSDREESHALQNVIFRLRFTDLPANAQDVWTGRFNYGRKP
jgi:hypothetical protein